MAKSHYNYIIGNNYDSINQQAIDWRKIKVSGE
jgi:hypothetical protein